MPVYVMSKSGQRLMPTRRFAHVRLLLKEGKAKVIRQKPFTIQLQYDTTEGKQRLYGGSDPGRTNIGQAVLNEKGEVIYTAEVETRNKEIPKLMKKRSQHRRASRQGERKKRQRRAQKNRTVTEPYAKERLLPQCEKPIVNHGIINSEARFCNRKRPAGWLTPTVRQLVETHLNMVVKICEVLPVTDWTLEVNRFAFMKMEDGTIRGVDFQNGRMKGYASVEDYIFALQEGKCPICGRPIAEYHHLISRSEDGSDRPENILGLCKDCHAKVTKGNKKILKKIEKIGEKKKYAALSVLNQAIPFIYDGLVTIFGEEHVHVCTGWETKDMREDLGLEKEHYLDAVGIAALGAGLVPQGDIPEPFRVKQFRRHDRARVKAQVQRAYQVPDGKTKNGKSKWKTVAHNRKKADQQEDMSLDEYIRSLPKEERKKVLSTMRVKPSYRRYNDPARFLPGTVFWYQGHRYVKRSQTNEYQYAEGEGDRRFPAKDCRFVLSGGLVYL